MDQGNVNKPKSNFKFKELRVYASTEWLANNNKKYRQVFDRYSVSYIYAELSFYNKNFDKSAWEVDVKLKCFELQKTKKELCVLNFKRKVSKYDNVVHVREGWGNKKIGSFWKKGTYYWEAWINGAKVATKYFYVEDGSHTLMESIGDYAGLTGAKLYEGHFDDVNKDDRRYLSAFSSEETKYVYTELELENFNTTEDWHCEIFVKFYNESKELKGQITRLQHIKKGEKTIHTTAGWGSNVKGSWRAGMYSIDVVFMDKVLASIELNIADDFLEGVPGISLPNQEKWPAEGEESDDKSFEEVLAELEALIGLENIKSQVKEHAQYIKFLNLRKDKGFEEKEEINIHSVFLGNPGTGKTTVAKMMGSLYKKMGLLKKGHVLEVDRVDLVGEYIGQTAPKVKEVLEKAEGGVLFIDEAYALSRANDDSKDFGREVIEILVKEMSNPKRRFAVIVAGYPKEMDNFVNSNPGLKSRFKHYFTFKDYIPQELQQIAEYACVEKEVSFTPDAKALINEYITEAYRNRDRSFGNARFVYDLVEKSKIQLGLRVMDRAAPENLDHDALAIIQKEDVKLLKKLKNTEQPDIPIDSKELELAIADLNELVGIENIKKDILELVNIVRYFKETGKDVLKRFFLHTVFVGNPGTGKTTVARILTRIYKALGILERGHMVETDRQGLIAGFVGQTAIKTAEKIDEAIGGVLFIDEAYALSNFNGSQGDYGNEAIQTMLKRMEDMRGEFFVFAAGYPENMDKFLKANPGLSSRFDKILRFDDYTAKELVEIGHSMILKEGYRINKKPLAALRELCEHMYVTRDKFFGNARSIRKLVLEVIKNQNLRIASVPESDRTKITISRIEIEDVLSTSFMEDQKIFERKSIGF